MEVPLTNAKIVILVIVGLLCVAGAITIFLYARQGQLRYERDALIIKYLGALISCGGLSWLCWSQDRVENQIAVPLIVCGVVMLFSGLKLEIVGSLREKPRTQPEE